MKLSNYYSISPLPHSTPNPPPAISVWSRRRKKTSDSLSAGVSLTRSRARHWYRRCNLIWAFLLLDVSLCQYAARPTIIQWGEQIESVWQTFSGCLSEEQGKMRRKGKKEVHSFPTEISVWLKVLPLLSTLFCLERPVDNTVDLTQQASCRQDVQTAEWEPRAPAGSPCDWNEFPNCTFSIIFRAVLDW